MEPLRDHIYDFHEGKVSRISFGSTGANDRKLTRYEEAIKGYKRFIKSSGSEWFKPHRSEWSFEDLIVRINPEVGFVIDEKPLLIKLYFKQERLTKYRVQVALSLMNAGQKSQKYKVAILDVVRGKLYPYTAQNGAMDALLQGEAATFLAVWNSLVANS